MSSVFSSRSTACSDEQSSLRASPQEISKAIQQQHCNMPMQFTRIRIGGANNNGELKQRRFKTTTQLRTTCKFWPDCDIRCPLTLRLISATEIYRQPRFSFRMMPHTSNRIRQVYQNELLCANRNGAVMTPVDNATNQMTTT